jgi:nicotinamidase-related amidase
VDLAALSTGDGLRHLHCIFRALQERTSFSEENATRFCEPYGLRTVIEKRDAKLSLQIPNLPAQRRLGDVKPHCRARQVLLFGNSHKVSQMTEFHSRPKYSFGIMIQATRYFRWTSFAGTLWENKTMETKKYSERLTPENAVLLLIDHQVGLFTGVRDIPVAELKHNVVALAKAVKVLGVPIIVTATSPEMWGPIIPELTEALPGISIINRTTVNAFDEPRFAKAVEATGRKKLIIAGVSTEVCLALPAIHATGAGYDTYAVIDASGTFSETKRITGLLRMVQAGVIVADYSTVAVEMLKDNASPKAGALYGALDMSFAGLVGQLAGAFAKR